MENHLTQLNLDKKYLYIKRPILVGLLNYTKLLVGLLNYTKLLVTSTLSHNSYLIITSTTSLFVPIRNGVKAPPLP